MNRSSPALVVSLAVSSFWLAAACGSSPAKSSSTSKIGPASARAKSDEIAPFANAVRRDDLIRPGETHFSSLWQVTRDVENAAEGYWSFTGDRIVFQATPRDATCDRIYVTGPKGIEQLTDGRGVTTCSYFLPGDRAILYASTHAFHGECPKKPDMSKGYVWSVYPEYDVYVRDLESGRETNLTSEWGYDAEATVSPKGDRIVFTSTRSGDLELWTMKLDGSDLRQVTNEPGYDGGAFFSNDGEWLVFRSTAFTAGAEEKEIGDYAKLLGEWLVKPTKMELVLMRADGSERRQLTKLGKANWAPYFFPNDKRVVFTSNHHDEKRGMPNFDLFALDVDGKNLERITHDPEFDAFPVFSPNGRWLAFSSNRGGSKPGETNLFVAEWR